MTAPRSWAEVKKTQARRLGTEQAAIGYQEAREAFALGEQVKALRDSKGLSQSDLAERMGTSQSVIARIEGGGVRPSVITLERIARAAGVRLAVEFQDDRRGPMPVLLSRRRAAKKAFVRERRPSNTPDTVAKGRLKAAFKRAAKTARGLR